MPFFYNSGEEVRTGDKITYHGEPGEIESVADPSLNPEDWDVTELGGGVMVKEPKFFGLVFIHDPANDEDLLLLARAG